MYRAIILLVILIAVIYLLRQFNSATPDEQKRWKRNLLLAACCLVLLFLGVTGRLNWLFALVGMLAAFSARMLPLLLRYAPFLHRMWLEYITIRGYKQQSSQQQNQGRPGTNAMSKLEAYEVLGLKPDASEEAIISAHRKLMQKIHPDRGGSDYLAAKINLAKKTLLKQ